MADGHILIVDDDPVGREVLANLLNSFGMSYESARSGREALQKLLDATPDYYSLVVTDIHMPDMNGIEMTDRFRTSGRPDASLLPIVGLSADANQDLYERATLAGISGMALKPMTQDVLAAFITLFVRQRQASALYSNAQITLARRMRAERDRALAAEKAKSFFFSTVSHDIRTPLNAIIGFSQMLKMGYERKAEQDQAVESIITSGKTLLQLVNDILDLSKLEAGRMKIEPEPSDCYRLVEEIVDSFRAANAKPDLVIRSKVGPMPILMIDPQRVRQILFNLVGNAVKFTERGKVEIGASFEPDGQGTGTLKLEVSDTGCGISEEDQLRIANPYVQAGSNKSRHGGTGLGLAICRQLVGAMNGEIEMQSALGSGTTFYVEIPKVQLGDTSRRAKLSVTQKLAVHIRRDTAVRYRRVLVADDSKVNILVITSMLRRLGVPEIVTVLNGREALDKISSVTEPFDLVLTDMWMPEMDGEGLVRAIRAREKELGVEKPMPVYAVTADVEAQKNNADCGFTGIILKPLTIENLKEIVCV